MGSLQNWQENGAEFTNENETPFVVATALVDVIVTVVVVVVAVVVVVVVFLSKAMETLTVQYRDNTLQYNTIRQ